MLMKLLKTGTKHSDCGNDLTYVYNKIFGHEPSLYECIKCGIVWDRPIDLSMPTLIYKRKLGKSWWRKTIEKWNCNKDVITVGKQWNE